MKKILITGSNGFIGKNLIDFYSNKYEILKHSREDDIKNSLNQNPDIIINCAANIYEETTMFSSNIKLVYDLIQYVKNTNNKMIHIGSSAEYGKKNLPSKESDKLEPRNAYEASKAAATMLCVGYAKEYNLPISVIRPYSVYGIYEKDYRLFPKLFDAFYKNIKMTLNQGYHDFIYVKDFINGIDLVLNTTNAINGDIINMGSGKQYSNFEIYDIFKNIAGKPAPVELNNKFLKKFENDIWVCDTTYSKNVYGFETKYSIEQGIQDYINTRMEKNI